MGDEKMTIDFDKLKNDIFSAGKDMSDRVAEASKIAKVMIDIHNKEEFIEKQFAELGRVYYLVHKNDEEPVPEHENFTSIQEAEKELGKLKDELLNLQGAVICPVCGLKQQNSHKFCSGCGEELKREEEASEEIFEDEEPAAEAEPVAETEDAESVEDNESQE